MRRGTRIVPALCLAAAAAGASAQAPAEMRGAALEAGTRRPLTGAVAALHSLGEPGRHFFTSADAGGRFSLQNLPAGRYLLEVSLEGYLTVRKDALEVRPPFRSIIEVLLERAPPSAAPASGSSSTAPPAAGAQAPEAAEPARLRVTLVDGGLKPVPEGLVAVTPAAGGERQIRITDASGRAEFDRLPARDYRLTAAAAGFLTVRADSLALPAGAPSEVAVTLTPYPLDFKGAIEDLLPPEEPMPPPRREAGAAAPPR
jgi:hypothetical protein